MIDDSNSGSIAGYSGMVEDWKVAGTRQPASVAYATADCKNVTILNETTVHKVVSEGNTAVGVETSKGVYRAAKVIRVSAGSYRIPQVPLLSGIGPAATLFVHDIPVIQDLPDVGKNLHGHLTGSWDPKARHWAWTKMAS